MPKKIQDFAKSALVKPVVVNVGRAGAASLDVIQEVEYVKQEAKIVYLLECLQKTAPPVLIFAENKNDVDDIYEYLLLKNVEAVAIHGGKSNTIYLFIYLVVYLLIYLFGCLFTNLFIWLFYFLIINMY